MDHIRVVFLSAITQYTHTIEPLHYRHLHYMNTSTLQTPQHYRQFTQSRRNQPNVFYNMNTSIIQAISSGILTFSSNVFVCKRILRFVLFLYIILYPHSRQRIGSLDLISFSVWHSKQENRLSSMHVKCNEVHATHVESEAQSV